MFELKQENCTEILLQQALVELQTGKLILLCTNEYYTIVCNASHNEAVYTLASLATKSAMQLVVIMTSEREILQHTASIDLAVFDALAQMELNKPHLPIAICCNGALNLAEGVENSKGQFLIHKTNNELTKQLIKRLRNPICCLKANKNSNILFLNALLSTISANVIAKPFFFSTHIYQWQNDCCLMPMNDI